MGLVDSGADTTSFPFGYASLMGYTPATLNPQMSFGVAGSTTSYLAKEPSSMFVPEVEKIVIDIRPLFIPGSQMVLWGRDDFMMRFDVAIREKAQEFSITP